MGRACQPKSDISDLGSVFVRNSGQPELRCHPRLNAQHGRSGWRFELALDRRDFGKRRQARLIAEMLDLVGGCRPREAEMFLPALRRVGEVGINIGAVEDVSRSTGIENSIRRYGKRGKRPNGARLVVPDQASLSECYPTKPAAPALEIIEHRFRFMPHLLAQALGHDRHVDEAEEFVGIRPQSSAVERGENPGISAQLGVVNRGIRLVPVDVKRAATLRGEGAGKG